MTTEAFNALNLPIPESDKLYIESGLEWLLSHTTLTFALDDPESLNALPSGVKLFLVKFSEVAKRDITVSSETVGPLSKSFMQTGIDRQVLSLSRQLLSAYLLPSVRFIPCERRWK